MSSENNLFSAALAADMAAMGFVEAENPELATCGEEYRIHIQAVGKFIEPRLQRIIKLNLM